MSQAYFRDGLETVSSESEWEMELPRWTGRQPVWPEGTSLVPQARDLGSVTSQSCVLGKSLNLLSFSYSDVKWWFQMENSLR